LEDVLGIYQEFTIDKLPKIKDSKYDMFSNAPAPVALLNSTQN